MFQEPSPTVSDSAQQMLLERLMASAASSLPLPRLLLVFAHPDDEVIAVGGRMERLSASRLLTLTDGAPLNGEDARHHGFPTLEDYRLARREELRCALANAGLDAAFAPGFAEQVSDQTACLHLPALIRAIAREIRTFAPEAVLTHPYEGGHPDHDACAFVVHAAVQLVADEAGTGSLPIVEAPFYHISDTGSMQTGVFLASPNLPSVWELSPEEQERKKSRLACFRSQAETLAQFPLERESFRVAPAYQFTKPPHGGELLYEHFGWGMEGERFRRLAAKALGALLPAASSGECAS